MKTLVKICGLTRLEDARYCAAAGADYLGFVLYDRSPRCIPANLAKEIVGWIYGPETVGVFVDEDPEYVNEVAREVGFDMVQLHGSESPEDCSRIEVPVIKAIGVTTDTTEQDLAIQISRYRGRVRHILLDTSVAGISGGTGTTFDWRIADGLVGEHDLFVAGGINPVNVREVVDRLKPFGVDVSSGVEESPGIKSFEKVSALFESVPNENA